MQKFLKLADDLETIVIANDFCPVANCPERVTDHNNACAHKHLPFDQRLGSQQYISPSLHCRQVALQDNASYLKAPIISPNDIPKYEAIGARVFKLTDRVMPDSMLIKICEAYFSRHYDGNLFDLFSYTTTFDEEDKPPRALSGLEIENILEEGYEAQLREKRHFLAKPHIDAMKLFHSNFMKIFEDGNCSGSCQDHQHNPGGCSHCQSFTDKFLEIDPAQITTAQNNIRRIIEISRKRTSKQTPILQEGVTDWGEQNPIRRTHIIDTHNILKQSQDEHPESYQIEIAGKKYSVLPEVFPPSYFNDTEFFAEHLPILEGDSVLEIGPGTGIISIEALHRGASFVTGADINPAAVKNSQENAELHQMRDKTCFFQSDVFENLPVDSKFDRIFWNVPFGFVNIPLTVLEKSVFDQEYGAIRRYINEAKYFLTDQGKVYVGFSSVMGDFELLKKIIAEAGATISPPVAQKVQHEGREQPLTFEIFEIIYD